MADNLTTTTSSPGGIPTNTKFATRDAGTDGHWQQVDVGPAVCTPKTPGQYALAVSTSVVGTLTPASGATHALISVDLGASSIRWTIDGSNPTSANGHQLAAGERLEIDNPAAFKCLAVGSASTIQVSYHTYV